MRARGRRTVLRISILVSLGAFIYACRDWGRFDHPLVETDASIVDSSAPNDATEDTTKVDAGFCERRDATTLLFCSTFDEKSDFEGLDPEQVTPGAAITWGTQTVSPPSPPESVLAIVPPDSGVGAHAYRGLTFNKPGPRGFQFFRSEVSVNVRREDAVLAEYAQLTLYQTPDTYHVVKLATGAPGGRYYDLPNGSSLDHFHVPTSKWTKVALEVSISETETRARVLVNDSQTYEGKLLSRRYPITNVRVFLGIEHTDATTNGVQIAFDNLVVEGY